MKKLALLAVGVLATALTIVALAAAHGMDNGAPEAYSEINWDPKNKPACPAGTVGGFKVDDPMTGTYGPVAITMDGSTLHWALTASALNTYDMAVVMVKGGPDKVAVYTYDYADATSYDDYGHVTAVMNPNSGKPYGVSHVYFCFDPKGGGDN